MVTNEPTSDPVHTEADKEIIIKSGKIIKLLQIHFALGGFSFPKVPSTAKYIA